jgi:hypothetical protein
MKWKLISQILPQAAGVLKSKSYWLKNFESCWSCHKGSPKAANSQMILLPEATAKSKKNPWEIVYLSGFWKPVNAVPVALRKPFMTALAAFDITKSAEIRKCIQRCNLKNISYILETPKWKM